MNLLASRMILGMLLAAFFTTGCGNGDDPIVTTGTLTGVITGAETSLPVPGVRITLFNANSNSPAGASFITAGDGTYRVELPGGTYYLKLSKQGYENIPPKDVSPLPLNVSINQTTTYSVQMFLGSLTGTGGVSGRVTSGGSGRSGVSVVASAHGTGYSTTTDGNGDFFVYNVPPDTYRVQGWIAGFVSTDTFIIVSPNALTANINLLLSSGASGSVMGNVTFLATTNIEVDVSLTHPDTRETIPGLSTTTVSRNYMITNVPPGIYLARATYVNDGKVMDPDWIIKNGEPYITVAADTVARDFSVTGSIELLSPTNPSSGTQPVTVTDTLPTFTWDAYPSADDYVVEVINASGTVIWGGLANGGNLRRVVIAKPQTSIRYNADASATEELARGKVYRWKIYVSKDDAGEPNGWKLISASEDQRGLFKIVP